MIDAGVDVDPSQLVLAETEMYGVFPGPSWLRQVFVADFESMGSVRNPYDKCVVTKAAKNSNIHDGLVLVRVIAILKGGTAAHRKNMGN